MSVIRSARLRRLFPLLLVLAAGASAGVSAELHWAVKRGWPEAAPRALHGLADRAAIAAVVGPAAAVAVWLLILLAAHGFGRIPLPERCTRAARPFWWLLPLPLLVWSGAGWEVGAWALGIAFVGAAVHAVAGTREGLRELCRLILVTMRTGASVLRREAPVVLALDRRIVAIVVVYLLLWLPTAGRATSDPRLLAAFSNDEPMITQQLVGMTLPPWGNPGTAMQDPARLPAEWMGIRYLGVYYGGAYLDVALLLWAPLRLLGFPDFPTAPIVLRAVSLLAGLMAIVTLYNFAKLRFTPWVATASAFLLLTHSSFCGYVTMIHPDALQLALCLLALWTAVRHAETGRMASLVGLGILAGLVQGTKMGGPPLMPMSVLAVAWGGASARRWLAPRCWMEPSFWERLAIMGAVACAAFFACTPYAMLDNFYFRMWKSAWVVFRDSPFQKADGAAWMHALWLDQGPGLAAAVGISSAAAILNAAHRRADPAPLLALVLAGSVIAWMMLVVKLWVVPAYLLVAFAMLALLAADGFGRLVQGQAALRMPGPAVVGWTLLAWIALARGIPMLTTAFSFYRLDRSTVVEVDRWAQTHLQPGSSILVDDMAYVDPKFPRWRLHGGLLTYADLERERPDIFILSGSLWEAPHYEDLRRTQTYRRGQEGPFSVLLYQDLLDRGGQPGIDCLSTISPGQEASGADWPFSLKQAWRAFQRACNPDAPLHGPTIKVFRYRGGD